MISSWRLGVFTSGTHGSGSVVSPQESLIRGGETLCWIRCREQGLPYLLDQRSTVGVEILKYCSCFFTQGFS